MSDIEDGKFTFEGREYALADLSSDARDCLNNIIFCDEQILQLSNEWAIADTARIGYTNALKREIRK